MLPHKVRQNFLHQSVQGATGPCDKMKDGIAASLFFESPLHSRQLAGDATDPSDQLLLGDGGVRHGIGGYPINSSRARLAVVEIAHDAFGGVGRRNRTPAKRGKLYDPRTLCLCCRFHRRRLEGVLRQVVNRDLPLARTGNFPLSTFL